VPPKLPNPHNRSDTLINIMHSSEDNNRSEIYRVAVRLPPFWQERPAVWFAQAEAQFELAAITQQRTKFNHVVSQLSQQHAAEVEDLILSPPEKDPYDKLKSELVSRLSASREQRVRQLLSLEEMGDRKPSQFLRHLRSLAPDVPDAFLRTIWASRLPPHAQAILAGQTEGSLESTSNLADKICEVALASTTAAISPAAPDNTPNLLEKIEELTRQVASLNAAHFRTHSRSRDRNRSQSTGRGSRPDVSSPIHGPCWYHERFGNSARNCRPPCSHRKGNETSGR
jgi:hypothetical protein